MKARHPDQSEPNEFEIAVLLKIAEDNPEIAPTLRGVIPTLRVHSREFTGVGSFSTFAAGRAFPELTKHTYGIRTFINLPQLENGLDAILFIKEATPDFLEIVTFSESWDGQYSGFEIK